MLVRPATYADVFHIGRSMWDRGKRELEALGISAPEWVKGWMLRINRGDAVAFGPHAILGCDREGDAVSTAFQASASFEEPGVGRSVTREMRKAIPKLMRERDIHLVCIYSLCVDEGAPKWFRLLGFEEDRDYVGANFSGYAMRRFVRRA